MDPWCRPLGEKEEEGGGSSDNDDEEEEVTRPRGVPWPNGRLPLLDKLARPASDGEKRALNDDRYVARIDMPAAARTGAPPETAPAPAPAPEPEPDLDLDYDSDPDPDPDPKPGMRTLTLAPTLKPGMRTPTLHQACGHPRLLRLPRP